MNLLRLRTAYLWDVLQRLIAADDELHPGEQAFLDDLRGNVERLGLTDDYRLAIAVAEAKQRLPVELSEAERAGIMHAIYEAGWADGDLADAERAVLQTVSDELDTPLPREEEE